MPASTTCLRAASKVVDTGLRRYDGSDNRAHDETVRLSCVEPSVVNRVHSNSVTDTLR